MVDVVEKRERARAKDRFEDRTGGRSSSVMVTESGRPRRNIRSRFTESLKTSTGDMRATVMDTARRTWDSLLVWILCDVICVKDAESGPSSNAKSIQFSSSVSPPSLLPQ